MVWYSHLLKNFPQFIVIHTVKGFDIVNKAEIDVFLELSCFFDDPTDIGNNINKLVKLRLIKKLNHLFTESLYFPDVQAGFRKGRGTRDQIANIRWIMEKAREFQKNIYFCFIEYDKAFVWITINCGKF